MRLVMLRCRMKILFAISILSFFVLAWAVFSLSRHVRKTQGIPITEAGDVRIPSSPIEA